MEAMAWQQLSQHVDMTASPARQVNQGAGALASASADERLLRATRAMKLKEYDAAIRILTQEAADSPSAFIVYDLRAACYLHSGRHAHALDDAMHCTKLNPDWARGWARLGAAQLCLGHLRAAMSAYQRGLQLDADSKEMQLGVHLVQQAQQAALAKNGGDRRRAMHHAD